MDENRLTLSTRYAPPIDEVAGQLKEKLSGMNNPGELLSEIHRKIGEHDAEQKEETGLLSSLKRFWNTDEV